VNKWGGGNKGWMSKKFTREGHDHGKSDGVIFGNQSEKVVKKTSTNKEKPLGQKIYAPRQ